MNTKINIAVAYPNKSSSSETFIQAHLKGLHANIFGLYGGWFPTYFGDDVPIIKELRKDIIFLFRNGQEN